MSSLLPGFEYDIFISYRHKDNKYDGWVTEFVENLRRELEATFKEEISIYFDANAHDGLHETHDVDDSLKDKIKALIFIPIVSRTYCDPQSFAWKNEFIAFRDLAANDPFGLKIKVAKGNVSSRILPIRIHDLDIEDIKFIEAELRGVMRPVDFVFKSTGVNRPLRAHEDEPRENQNHTFYRDQINKVAMAVREIIVGMQQPKLQEAISSPAAAVTGTPKTFALKKVLVPVLILLLVASAVFGITTYFNGANNSAVNEPEEEIDRSIAVLPFADMSANKDQEYFGDGLSEELLNLLAKIPDLKVISRTSAFSFKGKNEDIRSIGEKLNVAYLLEGSIRKASDKVRITAQLIRASDGTHIWSETFDRDMNDIFKVQDEIANAVVKELKLKLLGSPISLPRESKPEVYTLWLQSRFYANLGKPEDMQKAYQIIEMAMALDSLDARVWSQRGSLDMTSSSLITTLKKSHEYRAKAMTAAEKAIALDKHLTDGYRVKGEIEVFAWDLEEAEKSLQKAVDLDPKNAASLSMLGSLLNNLGRFDDAKVLFNQAIEVDPVRSTGYANLARSLVFEENFVDARKYCQTAIQISPRPFYYVLLNNINLFSGKKLEALQGVNMIEDDFWRSYSLIICLWGNDKKGEALKELKKMEEKYHDVGAFQIAEIYAWFGNAEKTFEWMDYAYQYRDPGLTEMKNSVFLKPFHQDPRYQAMLIKMKLPL